MPLPINDARESTPPCVALTDAIPAPMPDLAELAPRNHAAARLALARAVQAGISEGPGNSAQHLAPDEAAYCLEYAQSADHARARAAAGWDIKRAAVMRKEPKIQSAIMRARAAAAAVFQASADELVSELQRIAFADPRELVSYVYEPCAKCWPDEREAQTEVPPTPDPRCDFCRGAGVGNTQVRDTRDLSESGRALFAGIKQTQHGTYVLMHSKMDAIEKLLKIFGAYEMDNRQKLAPITELLEYVAANRQGLPIRK